MSSQLASDNWHSHIDADTRTVQILGKEPYEVLKPKVDKLLTDSDKNKQRAAAELLAGILNGEFKKIQSAEGGWLAVRC